VAAVASRLRAAALGLLLAATVTGCVSIPSGGAVQSYTVTQGPGGQSQPYPQIFPQAPQDNWTPDQVVFGFLTASASGGNGQQIVREYLAPGAHWTHTWNATVYKTGPIITATTMVPKGRGKPASTVVTIGGKVQASVTVAGPGAGNYLLPSASAPQLAPFKFTLIKVGPAWRIEQAPDELLLTSDMFNNEYQQRNLYFFDKSTSQYLVPDPVYVPLQDTPADLMGTLVNDLIKQPPDWLSGGTWTAFPPGTTAIGGITLAGGTATVNLVGSQIAAAADAKASSSAMMLEQISAQLLWTLIGSGQGGPVVQSVELLVNGKPWSPLNTQENPVQHLPDLPAQFSPQPYAQRGVFSYLDKAGNVLTQNGPQGKPSAPIARLGNGFSQAQWQPQIAVSPNPKYPYLAVLRSDGTLFTETIGGKLVKRQGTGYTSMSWDPNGNLWATAGDQIVMLRGNAGPGQAEAEPVPVSVVNSNGSSNPGPYSAIRVAPDGVRVAIIVGQLVLNFGAIAYQPSTRISQLIIKIDLSPFYVTAPGGTMFSWVTWYGTGNVIALGGDQRAPVLTEYPVSGGNSTSIPAPLGTASVTALLPDYSLIVSLPNGGMSSDATLTGAWAQITSGAADTPVKGFSPVYPG
jgi:hypothetical protein